MHERDNYPAGAYYDQSAPWNAPDACEECDGTDDDCPACEGTGIAGGVAPVEDW